MQSADDPSSAALNRNTSIVLAGIWGCAVCLAAYFLYTSAFNYRQFDAETYGEDYLWPRRFCAAGHIIGGTLALTIGVVQMVPALRVRYINVHRWLGRMYLAAIALAGTSALVLVPTVSLNEHWSWAVTLATMASVWILCAAMGYRAIRLRRIQQHKEWMIRSYVVTFAFVFFRILNVELFGDVGDFVERGPTFGWASWSVPLFITEMCLQWNKR